MSDDDEEARRRRAEWLRSRIREPAEEAADEPPRTPREFIEREMHERAEAERAEAEREEAERAEGEGDAERPDGSGG